MDLADEDHVALEIQHSLCGGRECCSLEYLGHKGQEAVLIKVDHGTEYGDGGIPDAVAVDILC